MLYNLPKISGSKLRSNSLPVSQRVKRVVERRHNARHAEHLLHFCKEINIYSLIVAGMLDSIYNMALKLHLYFEITFLA